MKEHKIAAKQRNVLFTRVCERMKMVCETISPSKFGECIIFNYLFFRFYQSRNVEFSLVGGNSFFWILLDKEVIKFKMSTKNEKWKEINKKQFIDLSPFNRFTSQNYIDFILYLDEKIIEGL